MLKLIESYLTNHDHFVNVNQASSSMFGVKNGVPQGSILGPLLFIIYTNDLCQIPDSPKLIMYPDDINIFFTAS